jgi:hypothetical protein
MTKAEVMAASAKRLKLLAEDADDLAVISAAVQDAVARVGDIRYEPAARTVTIACNRFRWEGGGGAGERVRTGLQFGGVLSCKGRRLRRDAPDSVISLLAIQFEPAGADDPGGAIILRFAGDADLRMEVECVDAALADVSDPWPTPRTPGHD